MTYTQTHVEETKVADSMWLKRSWFIRRVHELLPCWEIAPAKLLSSYLRILCTKRLFPHLRLCVINVTHKLARRRLLLGPLSHSCHIELIFYYIVCVHRKLPPLLLTANAVVDWSVSMDAHWITSNQKSCNTNCRSQSSCWAKWVQVIITAFL